MDGQLIWTNCDEAGDYVVPNVLSPRDLVSRPDNMDETVLSSSSVVLDSAALRSLDRKIFVITSLNTSTISFCRASNN